MAILLSTNVAGYLSVTSNIANTGNLAVSQNTVTGNLSVVTLANITMLNVSTNIANVGNILVTQNIYTGNLQTLGNVLLITGTTYMNIDTGLIQANASNMVLQTIASSNQNVVMSANGTANATLSNTGNLTLSSGNLITTYNVITGNLLVTSLANIAICNSVSEGTFANGTGVISGIANLNFNNTASINIALTANGANQTNIVFSVNILQMAINTSPIVNPCYYSYFSGV